VTAAGIGCKGARLRAVRRQLMDSKGSTSPTHRIVQEETVPETEERLPQRGTPECARGEGRTEATRRACHGQPDLPSETSHAGTQPSRGRASRFQAERGSRSHGRRPSPLHPGRRPRRGMRHIQTRDRDGTDHHETRSSRPAASGNRPPNNQDGAGTAEDQRPPDLPERTKGRTGRRAPRATRRRRTTQRSPTAQRSAGTAPRAPPPPPPSRHRHGPPGPATCQPPPNDLAGGANRGNHGMEVWNAGGGQRNG